MRYYVDDSGFHVIELTPKETDQFFDPFDPQDDSIPSYLHHRGHRYIKENVYNWLIEVIGQSNIDWRFDGYLDSRSFYFKDKKNAMMFKIRYFEQSHTKLPPIGDV